MNNSDFEWFTLMGVPEGGPLSERNKLSNEKWNNVNLISVITLKRVTLMDKW